MAGKICANPNGGHVNAPRYAAVGASAARAAQLDGPLLRLRCIHHNEALHYLAAAQGNIQPEPAD